MAKKFIAGTGVSEELKQEVLEETVTFLSFVEKTTKSTSVYNKVVDLKDKIKRRFREYKLK